MSFQIRSMRHGSRRTKSSRRPNTPRRGTFETLEARLTLAADLGFAGAFEILGGPAAEIYTSSGTSSLRGGGIVTDVAGNRYVTVNGASDHIVDLDPGPAVQAVTTDAALVKLDPNGSLLWSAALNATSVVRINHAVDADQNVYLVGDFIGTVDFDPRPGVTNVTSSQAGAEYSVYFAKLNSAGALQWVRKIDGRGLSPDRLVVDGAGNLVVVANFSPGTTAAPMDVDPGPGQTFVQQIGSTNLLVMKYNSNGDFVWVRQLGGTTGTMSSLKSVDVDNQGDIYVAGGFTGTVDLDPGAGTDLRTNPSSSAPEGFILRLDAAGNFVWAYATEGGGSTAFLDLDVADDGSVVGSGYFRGVFDADPGSGIPPMTATGDNVDGFAIKLNANSTVAWARQFGGGRETITSEVDVDQEGNVYLGGSYGRLSSAGQLYDFDPGSGEYQLAMPASYETGFVLSLTDAGDFRWAVPLAGNAGASRVQGISVTADGVVHLSGAFKGTGDFDPNPTAETLLNSGAEQSVFVATLTQAEPDPGAPVVDAGDGQTILVTYVANLHGAVSDDGLPNPVTTAWSLLSGPGAATFGNAASLDTTATFSTSGTYSLMLSANDGQFTSWDIVQVVVNPLTAVLTSTADTYIDTGKATTNFGTSTSLTADGKPDLSALLKWDLANIPAGSTLQSATLSVNVTGTSPFPYEIYELKRSWTESQATWKKANSSTNWQSAGAQGALDRGSAVLGTVSATATGIRTVTLNASGLAVVQGWINNPATNFGFVLQDYANTTADDLIFSSREATVAANRPQLQLVYNPPSLAPLARASSLSLQTQVADATASSTAAVKQVKPPAAISRILSAPGNSGLLAAVLSVHSASERAKHLAATTLLDKNDHDARDRHAACADVVLGTLGDQLLSKFPFLDR